MPDSPTPADTWSTMVARHAAAAPDQPRPDGVPEHRPIAAILACSDARVPPSLVFGQPAGSLFVVRLAGNSATAGAIASLTYAVDELGVDLIVVLGHSGCGAVTAAVTGATAPSLAPILAPIDEMLDTCTTCDGIDTAIAANVVHNIERIERDTGPLGRSIAAGRTMVVGAVHDLTTGRLVELAGDSPIVPAAPAGTR